MVSITSGTLRPSIREKIARLGRREWRAPHCNHPIKISDRSIHMYCMPLQVILSWQYKVPLVFGCTCCLIMSCACAHCAIVL